MPTSTTPRSSAYNHLKDPATLLTFLRHTPAIKRSSKKDSSGTNSGGGLLKMFKLIPLLTTGYKMVSLLNMKNHHRRRFIADHATIGTIFGPRRGRVTLAIQPDPHSLPTFAIELPINVAAFHKEMAEDVVRIALESETKTVKRKVTEEYVWAVYCNGRKMGYAMRRRGITDDEARVIQLLRGVSMGAGVLPAPKDCKQSTVGDGEMTYLRARFERVVGSKDSEALYMINPDTPNSDVHELSIFFVRLQ
ncbi:MIZU-KUSSEI 1-like protein [Drosera capensis]